MTMAELSSALFPIGVILVALGFAAHVGHAVMLANGRRVAMPAVGVAPQPAFAGVVTGSFVTERNRTAAGGPSLAASASPLSRVASGLTILAVVALGASLLLRGIVVGSRERKALGLFLRLFRGLSFGIVVEFLDLSGGFGLLCGVGCCLLGTGLGSALLRYRL